MAKLLESWLEKKKLDSKGRLTLPADWREAELDESKKILIIKRKSYLKLVPKRKVDLTEYFDQMDIGVESIGSWKQFEKRFYEPSNK